MQSIILNTLVPPFQIYTRSSLHLGASSCSCRRRVQGELATGRGVGCCGGDRGSPRSASYFLGSNDDRGGVRRGHWLETSSCFWRLETGLERREARGWRRTGAKARGSDVVFAMDNRITPPSVSGHLSVCLVLPLLDPSAPPRRIHAGAAGSAASCLTCRREEDDREERRPLLSRTLIPHSPNLPR